MMGENLKNYYQKYIKEIKFLHNKFNLPLKSSTFLQENISKFTKLL